MKRVNPCQTPDCRGSYFDGACLLCGSETGGEHTVRTTDLDTWLLHRFNTPVVMAYQEAQRAGSHINQYDLPDEEVAG